jgi:hypothetical protein
MAVDLVRFNAFPTISLRSWPKIKGAFLSVILERVTSTFHRCKTLENWKKEFLAMDDIGITYVVVQSVVGWQSDVLKAIFPSGYFPAYSTGNTLIPSNQVDLIFTASEYFGTLRNKAPIKIWLGTISGLTPANNTSFTTIITKLMTDLFTTKQYHLKPNWGGLYLSNESSIVKRTDTYACNPPRNNQGLDLNQPNWFVYSKIIQIAQAAGYVGTTTSPKKVSISPVYRPATKPYLTSLALCNVARWTTTDTVTATNAGIALKSMLTDARCIPSQTVAVTAAWIQNGLGFNWVKDASQASTYFSSFITTNGAGVVGYNMECFKASNATCSPGQITKTWTELALGFKAAYTVYKMEICVYEWLTNWSPVHVEGVDTNRTYNYAKYKKDVLGILT